MIRRPPRSTLFPTRRSSDLSRARRCTQAVIRRVFVAHPGRGDKTPASGHISPPSGRKLSSRPGRSEEHTSELQSRLHLVCRLLLEKKNLITYDSINASDRFD